MGRNPKQDANLKHGNPETQFRKSGREAVEAGRKGGKANNGLGLKRSTMSSIARSIATAPAPDKMRSVLESLGVADEDMTCGAAVVAGVYKKALSGDDKAVEKWETWTDAQHVDDKPYELPGRILGKAFVDLNRDIRPNIKYVIEGGRGSTKSSYVSEKLIELIKNTPSIHACVVRKVASTLKDSVFEQVKWSINQLGLDEEFRFKTNPLEIKYKKNGQTIYFRRLGKPSDERRRADGKGRTPADEFIAERSTGRGIMNEISDDPGLYQKCAERNRSVISEVSELDTAGYLRAVQAERFRYGNGLGAD